MASLILLQGSAQAGNYYWTVTGGGTWNSGNDWTTTSTGGAAAGTFPGSADFAIFNTTILNSAETITLDANQAASGLTFNNTGSTSIIGSTAATTTYSLTLGSSLLINPGAGAVTLGGGNMTVVSSGSITATNNSSNVFTLSAPVSIGTATTGNGSQLAVQGTGDTLISGVLANGTGGLSASLVKAGTGTLTLTAINTFTNTTSVNGGILRIDNNAGGSVIGTNAFSLGGGTLALLGKAGGTTAQGTGAVTLLAGTTSGIFVDGGTSTSTALNLGMFTQNPGSAVNITTANGGIVSTTQANTAGIIGSHVVLNGNDFAVGNGAGNAITAVTTTALNTAAGTDTLNSSVTGTSSLAGSRTTNSLTVRTDGNSLAVGTGNTLTLTNGGLLFTGTNTYAITGGTLRGNGTTEVVANQYSTGNVTISSVIAGGAFTKTGPGALTLSGNNTNTGIVSASAGTLTLSGDNSAASGGVQLSGLGATLNVNSATALGTGTFNINTNNSTTTLPILNNTSGAAVVLTTANPVTLSGSFNFGTSANTASNSLTLGSGLATQANNLTITLNGTSTLGLGGAYSPGVTSRFLTVNNGTGTSAATALSMNGLQIAALVPVGTTTQTANLAGTGNINIVGPITDGTTTAATITSGAFAVSSTLTGTLTISGANNSYTGGLSVGTTSITNLNSATALGNGGAFSANGLIDNTSGSALTMTNQGTANPINLGVVSYSTAAGTINNSLNLGNGLVTANQNRTLTLNGAGVLTFGGALTSIAAAGITITVNNGAGTAATSAVNFGGFSLNTGATATARVNTFAGTGNVNVTGQITDGTGSTGNGLNYTGSGRLTLSNAAGNNYTGATTFSGLNGTVVVSNTSNSATGAGAVALGSATANSPTTLASGAGNVGIITGTVTANGKTTSAISPGGAGTVGMLTLTNLTATAGTSFTFDLGASSGGTSSDLLALNGTLAAPTATGSGNLVFNFTNNGATPGTVYTLVTYNSESGLDTGDLVANGLNGTFSVTSTTGAGEIDFTVTPVPEPSTWVAGLLSAGLLLRTLLLRRRNMVPA